MEKENGWAPVHDTEAVWKTMWRQYRSLGAPEDPDYHVRQGTYARGVLWAGLPDHTTLPVRLHMHVLRRHGR